MTNLTRNTAHLLDLATWRRFFTILLIISVAGCGVDSDDGEEAGIIPLPTDDTIPFSFYCVDAGLFVEPCILDDPNNPYARSIVNEETKFDLDADAPSATARFYLWATALARGAGIPGENQFYVALNLHYMWASSNSEPTRIQAIRAYRSYLDNYFNSLTYFEIPLDSDEFFPQSLNRFTGQMLFDPADVTNTYTSARLFSPDPNLNRDMASMEIGEWGYYFDQDIEVFTKAP